MKKFLCVMLIIALFATFNVCAETVEISAGKDTYYYNVYLSGKSEFTNKPVTFLLIDSNDNPAYVREFKTGSDGIYELKFKFDGEISDYKFMLRDSETATDITNTVNTAIAKQELYGLKVNFVVDGNDVMGVVSDGSKVDAMIEVHNKYGNETKINILLASYDENNKLLGVTKELAQLGYNDLNDYKIVEFDDVYVPAGTYKMKAFAWGDTVDLVPLAQETSAISREPSPFVNENADPEDDWVVGLMGDSITHMGNYNEFLYHYYSTRYPGNNVKIVNRAISGSKSMHQMFRLEYEVLDPEDPVFGECDEIMLMIGMNDMGAWAGKWPHGKLEDDQYLEMYPELQNEVDTCIKNVEEVIVTCLEKGKKITLVTPSLHDEHESFATIFGTNYGLGLVSEGYKKLGEKYNIPVLDIYKASNMYSDRIRAAHPEATTVLTGTDSTHPDELGGYLLGYLFARAQETDEIVASVAIDAQTGNGVTEDAEISNVTATPTSISYTYLPKALPLYAEAPGYRYTKNFGVDITNTMNKEIIRASNLSAGTYSVKMDGVEVGQFTADELNSGVNIAELKNNPGKIQSKAAFDIAAELHSYESTYRAIKFVEHQVVNYSTTPTSKYYQAAIKNGTDYYNYTDEDWYDAVLSIREIYESDTPEDQWSKEKPIQWIILYLHGLDWKPEYPNGAKKAEDTIIANIKNCHSELAQATIPVSHSVEISLVQ